jgi:hypothetical protein
MLFLSFTRCYLLRGYCKKVVIVQMRDREGFAELQRNLRSYGIPYTIDEIPAELYDLAQKITCYTGHSPAGSANTMVAAPVEGTSKTYVFSETVLSLGTLESYAPGSKSETPGGELLRTTKENFVILSIDAAYLSVAMK